MTAVPLGSPVVVRPLVPARDAPHRALQNCSITVDEGAGTITWVPETKLAQKKRPSQTAPLPGRGPGAVTELVLCTFDVGDALRGRTMTRLLFVAADTTMVWLGDTFFQQDFKPVWPLALFDPLRAVGIAVTEERYPHVRDLARARPGAVGRAVGLGAVRLTLILFVVLAIALAIIVALTS